MNWRTIFAIWFVSVLGYAICRADTAGIASWYGSESAGRIMANGHPFNPREFTCASWVFPLGTRLLVRNPEAHKQVVVTVTDRGPAKRLHRAIDLSEAAFASLADTRVGLIRVTITKL